MPYNYAKYLNEKPVPVYFDVITQSEEEINPGSETRLYLVYCEDKYYINAISVDIKSLSADPNTNARDYLPIPDVQDFLNRIKGEPYQQVFFPEGILTRKPLEPSMLEALGVDLQNRVPFNNQFKQHIETDVHDERLAVEWLYKKIQTHFIEQITVSTYYDLFDAWEDFQGNQFRRVESLRNRAVIARLNIDETKKSCMLDELSLVIPRFDEQHRPYIESLLSLTARFPTHFERFAAQLEFGNLLAEQIDVLQTASFSSDETDSTVADSPVRQPSPPISEPTVRPIAPPQPPAINSNGLFSQHRRLRSTRERLVCEIHAFVREQFAMSINHENINGIESAWRQYQSRHVAEPFIKTRLQPLNISGSAQNQFFQQIDERYPHISPQDREFVRNSFRINRSCPGHAFLFGNQIDLTALLEDREREFFPVSRAGRAR